MCANNKKACLHGARGQRLGSLHDCACRKNQTLRAMTAARWLSSAATSSSELSELARSLCSIGTFWMMWRRLGPKDCFAGSSVAARAPYSALGRMTAVAGWERRRSRGGGVKPTLDLFWFEINAGASRAAVFRAVARRRWTNAAIAAS